MVLLVPKSTMRLNKKIASICFYNTLLRIWNVIYIIVSTHLKHLFMNLYVSNYFKNPQISLRKPKILPKIENVVKIIKNQQVLVFVTSPLIDKFYGWTTVFKEMRIFWIWKKKIQFKKNFFLETKFFLTSWRITETEQSNVYGVTKCFFHFFFLIQNILISSKIVVQP